MTAAKKTAKKAPCAPPAAEAAKEQPKKTMVLFAIGALTIACINIVGCYDLMYQRKATKDRVDAIEGRLAKIEYPMGFFERDGTNRLHNVIQTNQREITRHVQYWQHYFELEQRRAELAKDKADAEADTEPTPNKKGIFGFGAGKK